MQCHRITEATRLTEDTFDEFNNGAMQEEKRKPPPNSF
jgi:hypothetical protein